MVARTIIDTLMAVEQTPPVHKKVRAGPVSGMPLQLLSAGSRLESEPRHGEHLSGFGQGIPGLLHAPAR